MVFNAAEYLKWVNSKVDTYMLQVLEQLGQKHPDIFTNLQKDAYFFNEDGSPKTLTDEQVKEKINEVVQSGLSVYEADVKEINKLFVITEEDLKQFIIE